MFVMGYKQPTNTHTRLSMLPTDLHLDTCVSQRQDAFDCWAYQANVKGIN